MPSNANHRPAGSAADGPFTVAIDPQQAGWEYSGIHVLALGAGAEQVIATGDREWIVLPLEGGYEVEVEGELHRLRGRAGVFAGPTDAVYVPRDSEFTVRAIEGGRVAFPSARADRRLQPQFIAAEDVPVIVRGAGTMTRKVHDFCNAGGLKADRLISCEVYTPGGNWSSYPPHKHDENTEHESQLEEVYYFEVAPGPAGPGVAYQRVSGTEAKPIDVLEEVRSGDVVLIPHGWHGPSMAAPGYDLYYLNVMAGSLSGDDRVWKFSNHPEHEWVRETWAGLEPDPRLG